MSGAGDDFEDEDDVQVTDPYRPAALPAALPEAVFRSFPAPKEPETAREAAGAASPPAPSESEAIVVDLSVDLDDSDVVFPDAPPDSALARAEAAAPAAIEESLPPLGARVSEPPEERTTPPPVRRRLGSLVDGRWRLERILGHGAAGAVFEATDLSGALGDRLAAVKVLHDRVAAQHEQVARLLREARVLATLVHPGVAKVYGAGKDAAGHVYIAMERLEGETLHEVLARGGPGAGGAATLDEIVEIGRQLLLVVGAAHARRVLHRDIKPENVFLTRDDRGRLRVVLLDFGIAKLTHQGDASVSTAEGVTLGTPYYMSPEQCRGDTLTPAADLWSVGATLFHAFAGKPPFDHDVLTLLLQRIVTERAPSLSELRPDLPDRLVEVVDRALEPDPAARWSSAGVMAAALATWRTQHSTGAGDDDPW